MNELPQRKSDTEHPLVCPKCRGTNQPYARYCRSCGERIVRPKDTLEKVAMVVSWGFVVVVESYNVTQGMWLFGTKYMNGCLDCVFVAVLGLACFAVWRGSVYNRRAPSEMAFLLFPALICILIWLKISIASFVIVFIGNAL